MTLPSARRRFLTRQLPGLLAGLAASSRLESATPVTAISHATPDGGWLETRFTGAGAQGRRMALLAHLASEDGGIQRHRAGAASRPDWVLELEAAGPGPMLVSHSRAPGGPHLIRARLPRNPEPALERCIWNATLGLDLRANLVGVDSSDLLHVLGDRPCMLCAGRGEIVAEAVAALRGNLSAGEVEAAYLHVEVGTSVRGAYSSLSRAAAEVRSALPERATLLLSMTESVDEDSPTLVLLASRANSDRNLA